MALTGVREVTHLPAGYQSEIPGRSLREVVLQVVQMLDVPVEITYHKERVMCKLIAYDVRFRSEAYQPIDDRASFFLIPASKVPAIEVFAGSASAVIHQAIKRWSDGQANKDSEDDNREDWG